MHTCVCLVSVTPSLLPSHTHTHTHTHTQIFVKFVKSTDFTDLQ